jgi:hypothetical protein
MFRWAVIVFSMCLAALAAAYAYAGLYGINAVLRRGGSLWYATSPDDPSISASMRLALKGNLPPATAGSLTWNILADGFDVAELPVLIEGKEVDRLLLARINPASFRFEVHSRPAGDRELADWVHALDAVLVINGSYFSRRGTPDTPLKSQGASLGPNEYDARHGAFLATNTSAHLEDLLNGNWQNTFKEASNAMVSYPMLVTADGENRVKADERWLANRSFVGEDRQGRIIIGTTADTFFSLTRLAAFLRVAPLDLKLALNLDGGPVACQGIALGTYVRDFCGEHETAVHDGVVKRLTTLTPYRRFALPIVLAVVRR